MNEHPLFTQFRELRQRRRAAESDRLAAAVVAICRRGFAGLAIIWALSLIAYAAQHAPAGWVPL